jgi:hypothetical protein
MKNIVTDAVFVGLGLAMLIGLYAVPLKYPMPTSMVIGGVTLALLGTALAVVHRDLAPRAARVIIVVGVIVMLASIVSYFIVDTGVDTYGATSAGISAVT